MSIIATIKGNKLVIEADLDGNTSSKSGKSIIKASTGGFQKVGDYSYSLNVISTKK
jgi:hypothetical protein